MFENIGTAAVQALGFFGIFAFFIYQLISDKNTNKSSNLVSSKKLSNSTVEVKAKRKGLFSKRKNSEKISDIKNEPNKKGWFRR
mgnify:CR=1 FL=1|tara:strand:+ start:432 stop:683 length:252 start_codon:yes stop_codon:yes gene_type:complete